MTQPVEDATGVDLPVPGHSFTFGQLIDAQSLGDLRALRRRGRPIVRVTLSHLEEATS